MEHNNDTSESLVMEPACNLGCVDGLVGDARHGRRYRCMGSVHLTPKEDE